MPLIRLAGLGGHEVSLEGCNFIDAEMVAAKWSQFQLERGDICISTSASFGRPAVVRDQAIGAIFYTGIIRFRPASPLVDERYLKLFLGSRAFALQAEALASGSVIRHFGPSHIRRMKIVLPCTNLQLKIAELANALDDKIELNRRMNETLEAMAQAIFRDWFVDFGPTRRKLAGITDATAIMGGLVQDPARAAKLAGLFPGALGDRGLPEGWEVKTFLDLFELKRGYDLPSKSRVPGQIPIVSSSGPTGWHNVAMAQGPGIVTGRYGTIGEVFECPSDFWPLNTTLYVCDFKGHPYWFVFHVLRGLDYRKFTDKAAVPGVNRNDIHREPLAMPPTELQAGFQNFVAPLMAKTRANRGEGDTLAATRDLLLPKLMAGEIRLRAAEAMSEAAT